MSVKSSISLSNQQDAFARDLVVQGRFSSVSAVVQNGLELLRLKTEAEEAELAALKAVLADRRNGPFVSAETMSSRVGDAINRKRQEPHVDR